MNERVPAEVFPLGEFISEEIEARGWTLAHLAEHAGMPEGVLEQIVAGNQALTRELARRLGDAFGTGAELWMNLDASYQRSRSGDRKRRAPQVMGPS